MGIRADASRRLLKNKVAITALCVFILICAACLMAPYLSKWSYNAINLQRRRETPSREFWFGTDILGRDLFSRVLYGGRMTLKIAFASTVIAAGAGCLIGFITGYFGGRIDFLLSRAVDILACVPVFLLVIITEFVLGWGKGHFMYAMAVAAVPQFARLVRAAAMDISQRQYIEAARALGVSHFGIIRTHVSRNVAPSLLIGFTSGVAEAILTCTIMGYMGIGINPPTPEWGVIIQGGREMMRYHPHVVAIPCALIILTVASLSLFSDGLRDAMDPRDV